MNELIPLDEIEISEQRPVALWFSNGGFGQHVGFAYWAEDRSIRLLHLGWHHDLRDESPAPGKRRVAAHVGLDDISSKVFCAILRNIPGFAPEIKYGLNWLGARGSFDAMGKYTPPADSDGLTCATFISEAFEGAAFHVVDETSWPVDTDDVKAWRNQVIHALEEHLTAGPERDAHIEHVRNRSEVVRLQPAEIVAAAASDMDEWSLMYDQASALAASVITALAAHPAPA